MMEKEEAIYDFFRMGQVGDRIGSTRASSGNVEIENGNIKADPMYLKVVVNGKKLRMEIDKGSYAAII